MGKNNFLINCFKPHKNVILYRGRKFRVSCLNQQAENLKALLDKFASLFNPCLRYNKSIVSANPEKHLALRKT